MPEITIIASEKAPHQRRTAEALKKGFAVHGVQASIVPTRYHAQGKKHLCCWGWRSGAELRERGAEVLVMERGYLGDRFSFTSLGWNGLNGYADFGQTTVNPVERFQKFHAHAFRPWDPTGEYAVIMGQVPGDASLRGQVMDGWYRQKAREIHDGLGIPVYFRPHPEAIKKGHRSPQGLTVIDGSLDQVLSGAQLISSQGHTGCNLF